MRLNCYTNLKIELWSPSPFSVFDSLKNECNERAEVHGGGVQCGFLLKLPGFGISCRVPEHMNPAGSKFLAYSRRSGWHGSGRRGETEPCQPCSHQLLAQVRK